MPQKECKRQAIRIYGGVSKRSQRGGLENRLGATPRRFESCLLRQHLERKAQCLPFKVFLEETGFLEPARFACLRATCSPKKYAEGLPLAGNGIILSFKFKQGSMPSVQGVFGRDRILRTCKVRVPEGCLQPEQIRRGAPACGKRRYPVSVKRKS